MKNIVVATDLSPQADNAITRAVLLAEQSRAKLHILHVMQDIYPDEKQADAKKEAESILKQALANFKGMDKIDWSSHVAIGKPFDEITNFADRVKADLLVMGVHNKTEIRLREMFVGTTIERIIRTAFYPVLMVMNTAKGLYKKAVMATDFSPHAQKACETGFKIMPAGQIECVHVYDTAFSGLIRDEHANTEKEAEIHDSMDVFCKKLPANINLEKTVRKGSVYAELMGAIRSSQPDIVIIGTQGKSNVGTVFLGSTAKNLLSDPPTDILVTRTKI